MSPSSAIWEPISPSAERLSELAFRFLDFTWLGGGKMLLIHGPTAKGLHLFWLDQSGFAKAAYYPADPEPPHRLELEGTSLAFGGPHRGRNHRAHHAVVGALTPLQLVPRLLTPSSRNSESSRTMA